MTKARREKEEKIEVANFDVDADVDDSMIGNKLTLLPLELAAAPLDARRARAASVEMLESHRLDIVGEKSERRRRESELLLLLSSFVLSKERKKVVCCSTFDRRSVEKAFNLASQKSFSVPLLCARRRRPRSPSGR